MTRLMSGILAVCACSIAFGQPAPARFDAAAIKPADATETMAFDRDAYHIRVTSVSLEWLITWAYDVRTDRLAGEPAWLDSVKYDIVANAPPESLNIHRQPSEVSQLQLMMQTLLAERFQLALHRETRNLPIYALVAAKGGPKVKLTEASGDRGLNPFSMPGAGRLAGTGVTAEMLANVLSGQIGRTVRDQTGLTGIFDFKLEWDPGMWDAAEMDEGGAPQRPTSVGGGVSLFTALQSQLGLKLEGQKGPVEVLVIDHIERTPTDY
jgi:uncharacterized protein (TIGR03435 family)